MASLKGSSERHVSELTRMLTAFAAAVGPQTPLPNVSRRHCEEYLLAVQSRRCMPRRLVAYHRVLAAFFNWLVLTRERLAVSPMKKVPKPAVPQDQPPR